jgi:integrase
MAIGLKPNTVIKHHAIIRSALQAAIEQEIIAGSNAADLVKKPRKQPFTAEWYNAEEINELFRVIKGSPVEVPVKLAAYFGFRRSEVIGLKWDAIDFENKSISVRHKVVYATVDDKLTLIMMDELKSLKSYRNLPLKSDMLNFLNALKERQKENRRICGNGYNREHFGYICVNDIGDLLTPDYVSGKFSAEIDCAGLKHIRFHDLRHSCGSLLLSMGYSMKDIQEWLGHANYQTTADIYAHADPKNRQNMVDGLSSVLVL